ncbi:MAG: BrnT family toxin [Chloroflexi bacterium]|nr:BrnT family toxin [Chloroflexota bacterium]
MDSGQEDHIARHGVTLEEVEEVVFGRTVALRAKEGRYLIIGQTEAGRYLAVFIAPRGGGVFSLITARDTNESERRLLRARMGR